MNDAPPTTDESAHAERIERQAERERKARHEAEAIAERSLRHLYAQKERLALLQALAAAANAAADVDEAMREALALVCAHTGWPVGHVYRRRGDGLVPTALWCGEGDAGRFTRWRETTEGTTFARGEGLPGHVLATGKPAWIRDVAEDPGFTRATAAAAHGLHGAMAFPVLVGEEVEAVLEFFSDQPQEPDEALLELVAYAGVQLGYVVERQRLQRRHEFILGAAGDGLYGLDAEGRTTFVNAAAAALVGWEPDELCGRGIHDVLHHHRADGTPYPVEECPVYGVLREGRERRVTGEVFWRRDGTSFPVEYVATPLREGGEIAGVVVVFRDVSERVELGLLRASEARFRFLAALNEALLSLTDPDEITATANRLLGEHLGADRCAYADVEPDEDHFVVTNDYTRGDTPAIRGRFRMADFGAEALRLMRRNEPYVVDDVEADSRVGPDDLAAYRAAAIGAVVCVPLHREGRFAAGMAVHQRTARAWSDDEVALVATVIRRCWESIERARAVKALRESQGQLLALVDNLPELAWWALPDGHIDFYNQRWYEYTGTTFEQMEGWGWEQVHDPAVLPAVLERWNRSIATGAPFEMEFPLRGADGVFRWFLTRIRPLRDAEGRITRWIGTNTNIDEQKKTAAALEEARRGLAEANRLLEDRVLERTSELSAVLDTLRDSEALLDSVTTNALDGIAALEAVRDREGRIVDFRWLLVNPQAEAMYGRSSDELVGALQNEVLPAVREAGLHDALVAVVETGEPFRQEVPSTEEPDRWFSLSVSKRGDGVVALFRDVSEGKASEAALRLSERALQAAQKLAHVGSWRWDVARDRVTWSDELYRIFGYEPGAVEVDYERYAACLHPEDRDAVGETIQKAVAAGEGYELNHRIVRPDDAVRWIHSFGEVVVDAAGAVVALQGTAQDVTERVQNQQALQRYAAELEESNEELQKFAYVASHDLQEPLRMVTSFLQLLERRYEGQLDDTAREYIGYAVDGARRMQRLIQDLLTYSRIGTRGQDFSPADAGEVVLDVLHDLGPAIAEAGAEVEAEGLPVVLADKTQLHQLLLNLVGNALKFRRPDAPPRIRIAAAPARLADGRPAWRFDVADNGIGLDPQYAERIFQVFQRLHTRDEYEGTGIGLAICKKIVERHGGAMDVESQPGRGATFRFTLPAPPPPKPGAATP